jgi:hypothetical protein
MKNKAPIITIGKALDFCWEVMLVGLGSKFYFFLCAEAHMLIHFKLYFCAIKIINLDKQLVFAQTLHEK